MASVTTTTATNTSGYAASYPARGGQVVEPGASIVVPNGSQPTPIFTISTATVAGLPQVTSIVPATVPENAATAITINGSAFTGATGVKVNGVACTSVVVVEDDIITCTTAILPAAAKLAGVVVTTPAGVSSVGEGVIGPLISSVTPNTSPHGTPTALTIAGTGLTGTTGVVVNGVAATSVSVVSDISVTCTTAISATAAAGAALTLTTPSGVVTWPTVVT